MSKAVSEYIDTLHFRTYRHVIDAVTEKFPDLSDKEIKRIVENKLKDHYIKSKRIKPYMIKIFSSMEGTWFHDLYDNTKNHKPRYWHIFIGTNNRYAVAYGLPDKKATSIYQTLKQFIDEYHPSKLTSDQEPGFIEKNNLQLLTDNKVLVQTVPDQNHSSLGIIDRFIRTLRDMNTPVEKGKRQSHDEKYTFISEDRMAKLLNVYNKTYHGSIKCSPLQMFKDPKLEEEYILKMYDKYDRQQKIKDFELKDGSYVRFIVPRDTKKKRYQLTKECYKIDGKTGLLYNLVAKDGTEITKPRFQLFLCARDGSKPANIKWADTIPGQWNGVVKEILSYNPKTNKYKVLFEVPGQPDYKDEIPASYLRGNYPQQISELEKNLSQNKTKVVSVKLRKC